MFPVLIGSVPYLGRSRMTPTALAVSNGAAGATEQFLGLR